MGKKRGQLDDLMGGLGDAFEFTGKGLFTVLKAAAIVGAERERIEAYNSEEAVKRREVLGDVQRTLDASSGTVELFKSERSDYYRLDMAERFAEGGSKFDDKTLMDIANTFTQGYYRNKFIDLLPELRK